MPYNNTPITPAQDISGSTSLPLARVKKIIKADPDTGDCSNNAAFAIAIAAEMFTQHMVERAHNVGKSERRPRKNIQYRDIAAAVGKNDNLEFLVDVVPNTVSFRDYKKMKKNKDGGVEDQSAMNGQQKLAWAAKQGDGEEEMAGLGREELREEGSRATIGVSSQGSAEGGMNTRHSFDAVRNAFETGSQHDLTMEED